MKNFKMKYGKGYQEFEFEEENVIAEIQPNEFVKSNLSQGDIVKAALENPIESGRLRDIVKKGDTVCVIVPDITRAWQSPSTYVPPVIEELNRGGVRDEDILIISATGSHRKQTEEEHIKLVSEEIYKRIRVLDHDCNDEENLVYMGTTTRGTIVKLNKKAMECDYLVLTGGIVYHFIAGFGGGRKYILPGISSYETIMKNHSYSFNEGAGTGSNPLTRSGNFNETNPINADMFEAASFAKPAFLLNVVVDGDKNITHAFAGDYITAHAEGIKTVILIDGVKVDKKAEMVIASAGGFPKDMNLYQTSKTIINAAESMEEGGVMIIVSECPEGFGSPATEHIIVNFDNMSDREKDIRKEYSIGKGIAFLECEHAEKSTFILVTQMDPQLFNKTKIKVVKTITEAIELTYKIKGKRNLKTYLMPQGANTMPLFEK